MRSCSWTARLLYGGVRAADHATRLERGVHKHAKTVGATAPTISFNPLQRHALRVGALALTPEAPCHLPTLSNVREARAQLRVHPTQV